MTIIDPPPVASGKGVYIGSLSRSAGRTHPAIPRKVSPLSRVPSEQRVAHDWRDKFIAEVRRKYGVTFTANEPEVHHSFIEIKFELNLEKMPKKLKGVLGALAIMLSMVGVGAGYHEAREGTIEFYHDVHISPTPQWRRSRKASGKFTTSKLYPLRIGILRRMKSTRSESGNRHSY